MADLQMPGAPSMPMPSAPAEAPPLTLTPKQIAAWWSRIELARTRRKRESDLWKALLKAYLPPRSGEADSINSNVHFRNVEQKKASLFFQLPDLDLTPLPPMEGLVDPQTQQPIDVFAAVAAKREILNKLLGRDHANVKRTIDQALFDVLATSGVGATKICYQVDIQPTPQELPGPPTQMPGSVLGLQDVPGPTTTQMVPVPVYERWRWYRFSPNALLIPHDYASNDFDEAPWLAMEFVMPLAQAKADYGLPDDFTPNATRNDLVLDVGDLTPQDAGAEMVKGVEVWLHAALYDPQVAHSQVFYQLVLIDGQTDTPAKYRLSPYQTLGPDGRLTNDSMLGNPIHPLTLRDCSDTAWVLSDAAFTNPLVKQQNTWRAQAIKARDANLPRFVHAESITEALEKLKNADVGQGVGIPDDKLAGGLDKLIFPLPHLERAESDIQGEASIRRDIDETLAIGSNQAGAINSTVRSATEIATVQSNVTTRMQSERGRTIEWYLSGVRKYDSLVLRYGDLQNLTPLVGATHAQLVLTFKAVNGRNAFDAKADSQVAPDAAADRKNWLDWTNFTAKSPFINQFENMREGALKFGLDPSKILQQPQPQGPPPPSAGIAFKGDDLVGPASAIVLEMLQQAGWKISPQAIASAAAGQARVEAAQQQEALLQTVHGGSADKAELLSKHHGELTGQMPGAAPPSAVPAQPQAAGMVQ